MRARDWAMAMRCSAGRLSPARLERGGRGAAQAAPAALLPAEEDTGPRTRAEGEGVQVEAAVEIRGGTRVGAVEAEQETETEEEEAQG